ncbi:general stress protein [Aquipuribacter hungaricus]|uniref:General stress protein n=1 Tax=Aquipuribacter hungaricus TaxID=545624 RepID=A0ABV7WCW3_9MICO
MAFSGNTSAARGVPRLPTPFHGELIASYATYEQAQRAVDYLSDEKFPVQKVAIVGTDLRMVERVTGRLSYPRVALAGAFSGAYLGLFVGLLLSLFGGGGLDVWLAAVLIGAGFGMLFGVLSFSLTGGRRDFTSASQIVASQYQVMAVAEVANQARNTLRKLPNSGVDDSPLQGYGEPTA